MYGMHWQMPAEWEPHERTLMAWPSSGYTLGDTEAEQLAARTAWANVANAVINFEPVTMVVHPGDEELAKRFLDPRIELVSAPLDDAWMRDIGPTFVKRTDEGHQGELGGVNWVFNGWGAQPWATWENDAKIAKFLNNQLGVVSLDSPLVNEGGGIHVNGAGVVLLTDTVQLGEGRNHMWQRHEVEEEIHRMLGTSKAIWLERGLTRDYDEFGTRGHVDIVACFSDANTILYHDQRDPSHPDFLVSAQVRETLERASLEQAGDFKLIPVPAPKTLKDEHDWVDYSYINHYIVNGGVILCAFDDPNDQVAKQILEQAYPGRKVVLVDAREIFARGGGIHCITQQQPK